MIKVLRYSLIALLALVCNVCFADTVVTFTAGTDNGKYTGSGTAPTSGVESISKDGVTIGTTGGAFAATNYNTKSGEYRIYKSQTFTASVEKGTIKKIVFTCTAKGTTKQGPGCFSGTGYTYEEDGYIGTWTGNASSVSLTTPDNQVRATKIEVTIDVTGQGGGTVDPTPDPTPEITTVANIAAFKALATGTTAILTLKDAQVVYKNEYTTKAGATNTELYVRDATGAVQFFNTGLELEEGQILNGTVEVKYSPYNGMPEAAKTSNTSLEKLTVGNVETVAPKQVTVSDLTDDTYLCELVQVSANVTVQKEGTYTNTYLESDGDQVMFYDKFQKGIKPADGSEHTYVGILVAAKLSGNQVIEFAPTAEVLPTGINGVQVEESNNAPAYNLAGQKVAASYKGIVIKNGKKFVQK